MTSVAQAGERIEELLAALLTTAEAWLRETAGKFAETCDPELCYFGWSPDVSPERHEPMKELAAALMPNMKRIIMDTVGCVIIAHVGGNCYGLIGMTK